MPLGVIILHAIVALAFLVEATLGFGATVVTVALGSLVIPLDVLLPAFVPLNVLMSGYLVTRYRASIDLPVLFRRVLPAMLVGLPFGIVAFRAAPEAALRIALGAFVVALAVIELSRPVTARAEPLARPKAIAMLLLAGAVHGAFASGGPMVVYVVGRDLGADKTRFRATLAGLWLILNAILVATYTSMGTIRGSSLSLTATLALSLVVGAIAGEWLHARVPAARFRLAVFGMLGVAGAVLGARAALSL
jgi:hypothetical protein